MASWFWGGAFLLAGCADGGVGGILRPADAVKCGASGDWSRVERFALDEPTPIGTTADDALARVEDPPFTWLDGWEGDGGGTSATLHFEVDPEEEVRFQDFSDDSACDDTLEIPAHLRVSTDDGRLDISVDTVVDVAAADEAPSVYFSVEPETNEGSWAPSAQTFEIQFAGAMDTTRGGHTTIGTEIARAATSTGSSTVSWFEIGAWGAFDTATWY